MINGQTLKEVDDEGIDCIWKYLRIQELDKFKEREMKDIFRTEQLRRFKLVIKSHLNGKKQNQSSKHMGWVAHKVFIIRKNN